MSWSRRRHTAGEIIAKRRRHSGNLHRLSPETSALSKSSQGSLRRRSIAFFNELRICGIIANHPEDPVLVFPDSRASASSKPTRFGHALGRQPQQFTDYLQGGLYITNDIQAKRHDQACQSSLTQGVDP
jgi:hypothetical protein